MGTGAAGSWPPSLLLSLPRILHAPLRAWPARRRALHPHPPTRADVTQDSLTTPSRGHHLEHFLRQGRIGETCTSPCRPPWPPSPLRTAVAVSVRRDYCPSLPQVALSPQSAGCDHHHQLESSPQAARAPIANRPSSSHSFPIQAHSSPFQPIPQLSLP